MSSTQPSASKPTSLGKRESNLYSIDELGRSEDEIANDQIGEIFKEAIEMAAMRNKTMLDSGDEKDEKDKNVKKEKKTKVNFAGDTK